MVDTAKALDTLQSDLADNSSGAITPQLLRDFLVSVFPPQYQGAQVKNTSAQIGVLVDATWSTLDFTSEVFDTDGYHDNVTNNSRLTVPAGMGGLYLIVGMASIAGGSAVGRRGLRIIINNTDSGDLPSELHSGVDASGQSFTVTGLRVLAATDYVELQGYQNQGAAEDIQANAVFSMVLVGQAPV